MAAVGDLGLFSIIQLVLCKGHSPANPEGCSFLLVMTVRCPLNVHREGRQHLIRRCTPVHHQTMTMMQQGASANLEM